MNEYGVMASIRESQEGLIILYHITNYYEGYKAF